MSLPALIISRGQPLEVLKRYADSENREQVVAVFNNITERENTDPQGLIDHNRLMNDDLWDGARRAQPVEGQSHA